MDKVYIGYIINIIIFVAGYIGGSVREGRKRKRDRLADLKRELEININNLSESAVRYYTTNLDERERNCESALISHKSKTINYKLKQLEDAAEKQKGYFYQTFTCFHEALTAEPFGDVNFNPIVHNHRRIRQIESAESDLLGEIESV